MKKIHFLIILLIATANLQLRAAEIFISTNGADNNPGTPDKPLASLQMALRKARELRRLNDASIKDGIHIILKGGIYTLNEPVLFRPEDAGTKHSPTIIEASEGDKPILSGGIAVKNWKKVEPDLRGLTEEAKKNVWSADIPVIGGRSIEFRQLWVNNKKATRAGTFNNGKLNRILSVDKEKQEIWIPIPSQTIKNPEGIEFVIHQWWAIAILRVKSFDIIDNKARLTFHQPESRIEFEHPWPAPFIDEKKDKNGNSAFYMVNAPEFLDQPGEWYEDIKNGKVYYWPKPGEDMAKAEAYVPFLENLVQIEGTLDNQVSNIKFHEISFEHSAWMRPSVAGHVPLQAGMFILDAYKLKIPGTPDKAGLENQAWTGRQMAAVSLLNANNITFESCYFSHLAATGLDFISGTSNNKVIGCIFNDIAGTGIQMGFFGNAGFEAHLPYNPTDKREVCNNELISNNLITNCANEDWGCVGISVGYAHDINIEHNELSYLNYSGICVGWGWTKTINCMKNNKVIANHIHHFARQMYDVGGIYTLSAQPNTEISRNSIHDLEKAPYAHDPNHYQYIYLDEGTSFIRAIDNWSEKDKFFSNTPGPGNEWKNNGPQVSEEIKNAAGLEPQYQNLLKIYSEK